MRDNLIELIYEGKVDIDSLSDEEALKVLADYNTLAEHWVTSPKEGLVEMGKEILEMIEESGLVPPKGKETLH